MRVSGGRKMKDVKRVSEFQAFFIIKFIIIIMVFMFPTLPISTKRATAEQSDFYSQCGMEVRTIATSCIYPVVPAFCPNWTCKPGE
jgi:hypothetical protein